MSALSIQPTFPIFTETDGLPLENGYIWIGAANLDPQGNPISVYWDAALTIAAPQPVRTLNGYPSRNGTPGRLYVNSDYSIRVQNSKGSLVYSAPAATERYGNIINANDIDFTQTGVGAVTRTVQLKLQETFSPGDYGASGDGVTNDTNAIDDARSAMVSGNLNVPTETLYDYGTLNPGSVKFNAVDHGTIDATELLTNHNFDGSATGWALTNFTYTGGNITHVTGSSGTAQQTISIPTSYQVYILEFGVTTTVQGLIDFQANGESLIDGGVYRSVGTYTDKMAVVIRASGSVNISVVTDSVWAGSIGNISLKKVGILWQANDLYIATDDTLIRIPSSVKFGPYNAGNIAIGDILTMPATTAASAWNVAIGARALASTTDGIENTAIGAFALKQNNASRLTAVGYSALKANTSGTENTAVGFKSGYSNTVGTRNTYLGFHTSYLTAAGNLNTVIGYSAQYSVPSANGNTIVGGSAALALSGDSNTVVGANAATFNVDESVLYPYDQTVSVGSESRACGDGAVAVGFQSRVGDPTTAANNAIAIGTSANCSTTSGVAIGYNSVSSSDQSVAIGVTATASGSRSVSIGETSQATGTHGVAVGGLTDANAEGSTAVGFRSGVNWTTGVGNTFLGKDAGLSAVVTYANCTLLGYQTEVTGSNQVQLGNSATTTYAYGAVQNRSDANDKADVRPTVLGLDFINALRPVDFKWDMRDDYFDIVEEEVDGKLVLKKVPVAKDGSRKRNRFHHGLIAQEVKMACDAIGVDFGGYQDHSINGGKVVLSLGYEELIAPLIKAVQQLSAEVAALKAAK
jgi:hypothetical protein